MMPLRGVLLLEKGFAVTPWHRPNEKKSRPGGRLSSNLGRRHKDGMRILRNGPVSRTVERENGVGMVNERLTRRRAYCGASQHSHVGIV